MPEEGELVFNGTELPTGKPPWWSSAGIARTFQNIRLFREMTAGKRDGWPPHPLLRQPFRSCCRPEREGEEERLITERAFELLRYVGIERFADTVSKNPPMATSAASRSPARWPPSPSCWPSTNPPPA